MWIMPVLSTSLCQLSVIGMVHNSMESKQLETESRSDRMALIDQSSLLLIVSTTSKASENTRTLKNTRSAPSLKQGESLPTFVYERWSTSTVSLIQLSAWDHLWGPKFGIQSAITYSLLSLIMINLSYCIRHNFKEARDLHTYSCK